MGEFRIVFNEQRGLYRVERRGWFGWAFLRVPGGDDYATFASYQAALDFACRNRGQCAGEAAWRRWRVVDPCSAAGAPGILPSACPDSLPEHRRPWPM
jgi:hypothetical protein